MTTPPHSPTPHSPTKAAWTIEEWCADAGCKKSKLYTLLAEGAVEARKFGRRTVITTPPADFITRLPVFKTSCAR